MKANTFLLEATIETFTDQTVSVCNYEGNTLVTIKEENQPDTRLYLDDQNLEAFIEALRVFLQK